MQQGVSNPTGEDKPSEGGERCKREGGHPNNSPVNFHDFPNECSRLQSWGDEGVRPDSLVNSARTFKYIGVILQVGTGDTQHIYCVYQPVDHSKPTGITTYAYD